MSSHTPRQPPVFEDDDLAWIGDDGDLDPSELISKFGYDPEPALRLIVRSIIAAHPDPRHSSDREAAALAALTGDVRRGRREQDHNDLLLEVARLYKTRFWEAKRQGGERPKIASIVREVIHPDHPRCKINSVELDSLRKELERKFKDQKDLLLARVHSDNDDQRRDRARAVRAVLVGLEKLGIRTDQRTLGTK